MTQFSKNKLQQEIKSTLSNSATPLELEISLDSNELHKALHRNEPVIMPIKVIGHKSESYVLDTPFGFDASIDEESDDGMSEEGFAHFACALQATGNAFYLMAVLGQEPNFDSSKDYYHQLFEVLKKRPLTIKCMCDNYIMLNEIVKRLQEHCFRLNDVQQSERDNGKSFHQYFEEHGVPLNTVEECMDSHADNSFVNVVEAMPDELKKAYAASLIECAFTPADVPQTKYHHSYATLKLSITAEQYICATISTEISALPY